MILARLRAFDPEGMQQAKPLLPASVVYCRDALDAAEGADALVLITEWNEFRALSPVRLRDAMRGRVVVDLRNVYDPVAMREDALVQPESRARFRALLYLGLTDTYRAFHRESHRYTFWDYQAGRWNRDEGLRIDHLLLSPHAADRVVACDIDKSPRGKERASDHTPIWCELTV